MGGLICYLCRYLYGQSGFHHRRNWPPHHLKGFAHQYRSRDLDYHRLYLDDDDIFGSSRSTG